MKQIYPLKDQLFLNYVQREDEAKHSKYIIPELKSNKVKKYKWSITAIVALGNQSFKSILP